ncbi:hypothetical protein FisN_1Lh017 [Fistulifera solaris]|uniref:Uncharacterized protein n=1 Tax=Fistulifera solaris TaxID=1519565 RepID=A0A1Z5JC97_FISSO|nr:hypothetical protein FisN_1Lh017 [Fistulifera solaris]|eukprot:GAX11617.1 hypothetical protein FisN_1Lh017 [Fistulifera solaris]
MPWRTLCGFPPTAESVTLRIPNGAWRPDTVITDYDGNEMFVLLDQTNEMRSYEAVFGDLEGRRLVCIKRHLMKEFWKDGYYICTYKPNWPDQPPLTDRDVDNKKVYPFSYVQVTAMKGRFFYRLFNNDMKTGPPRMMAENPWMGFMVVCCTNAVRFGKWAAKFKRATSGRTTIHIDQWKNVVKVGPGNDLMAALCLAYIFDRYQCQPFITVFGRDSDDEYDPEDDESLSSKESHDDEDESDTRSFGDDDDHDNNRNNSNSNQAKSKKQQSLFGDEEPDALLKKDDDDNNDYDDDDYDRKEGKNEYGTPLRPQEII